MYRFEYNKYGCDILGMNHLDFLVIGNTVVNSILPHEWLKLTSLEIINFLYWLPCPKTQPKTHQGRMPFG